MISNPVASELFRYVLGNRGIIKPLNKISRVLAKFSNLQKWRKYKQ